MTTFTKEPVESLPDIDEQCPPDIERDTVPRRSSKDHELDPAEEGKLLAEKLQKALKKIFAEH